MLLLFLCHLFGEEMDHLSYSISYVLGFADCILGRLFNMFFYSIFGKPVVLGIESSLIFLLGRFHRWYFVHLLHYI